MALVRRIVPGSIGCASRMRDAHPIEGSLPCQMSDVCPRQAIPERQHPDGQVVGKHLAWQDSGSAEGPGGRCKLSDIRQKLFQSPNEELHNRREARRKRRVVANPTRQGYQHHYKEPRMGLETCTGAVR